MNNEEPKPPLLNWIALLTVAYLVFVFLLLAIVFPLESCGRKLNARPSTYNPALNGAQNLRAAVKNYFTEYHKRPVGSATEAETGSNWFYSDKALMNVLMVLGNEAATIEFNPQRIYFYAGIRAKPAPDGSYRNGITQDSNGAELFDPWGNHYRVMIDLDGDGYVPAPDWAKIQDPIRQPVIVWSPGPDGKDDTEKDNVISW